MKKINLRNVAVDICDIFEDWLEEKDITIPNEERDEYTDDPEELEELSRLFGSDYYELEDITVEELNLFATNQVPNGLFEVIEEEISDEKGAETITSHFLSLLDYYKFPYEETDKQQLIEDIKNVFNKLEKMIQNVECEFETDYCDGYGIEELE